MMVLYTFSGSMSTLAYINVFALGKDTLPTLSGPSYRIATQIHSFTIYVYYTF